MCTAACRIASPPSEPAESAIPPDIYTPLFNPTSHTATQFDIFVEEGVFRRPVQGVQDCMIDDIIISMPDMTLLLDYVDLALPLTVMAPMVFAVVALFVSVVFFVIYDMSLAIFGGILLASAAPLHSMHTVHVISSMTSHMLLYLPIALVRICLKLAENYLKIVLKLNKYASVLTMLVALPVCLGAQRGSPK